MKPNFSLFPIIETERLSLRAITYEDAPAIQILRSHEIINQYIDRPKTENIAAAIAFIDQMKTSFNQKKNLFWIIVLKSDEEMIGSICLWNFSDDGHIAEVGYALKTEFQNKGIMSEALKAIIDFGFEQLHLHSIEAFTHRNNESSKRILVKKGFVLNPNKTDEGNLNNMIFELKNR